MSEIRDITDKIFESLDNAVNNGYGYEVMCGDIDEVAIDCADHDSEIEEWMHEGENDDVARLELLTATIDDWRRQRMATVRFETTDRPTSNREEG